MSAPQFADHFSGVAGNYAIFRPRYPRALFEWLANASTDRQLVWDCATGNGQAATALADYFDRVIATDASADQIATAILHPKIDYRVAASEASGLPNRSVSAVAVAQAAHWFNLARFYDEARRVAKPGALLALWCYGEMRFGDAQIDEMLDHYYREVVGPYWPPERKYVEEGYASLHFPFSRLEAPFFQIDAEFTAAQLVGYLRTWSSTQRYRKARGHDPVVEIENALRSHWPEGTTRKPRDWPISVLATRLNG